MKIPAFILLSCCVICPVASAVTLSTFTLTTSFDATFNSTLTAPFVGTGSLSYDALAPLADGAYDWSSFTNLQLSLSFGETIFTQDDLTTPIGEVNVEIRDGNFFFSNDFWQRKRV
jgi:hypothetical protein